MPGCHSRIIFRYNAQATAVRRSVVVQSGHVVGISGRSRLGQARKLQWNCNQAEMPMQRLCVYTAEYIANGLGKLLKRRVPQTNIPWHNWQPINIASNLRVFDYTLDPLAYADTETGPIYAANAS
jgi:hypothetical protein